MAWARINKKLLVLFALSHACVSALDVSRACHKAVQASAERKRNHAFQKQPILAFQPNLNLRGGDGVQIEPSIEESIGFCFQFPFIILSLCRLSSYPVDGSTALFGFLSTILSARFTWNWMALRWLNVLSRLFFKRKKQSIQVYLAISCLFALLNWTALRTFFQGTVSFRTATEPALALQQR